MWIGLLTILIVGPWLLPGYIFGTDFPGPRHFYFPTSVTSYSGLEVALAFAALIVSGEVIGKAVIIGILVAAGLGAYLAIPIGGFAERGVASCIYLFNPFVYDRLAYGQLTVLAGYAMLPWVASGVRRLALRPSVGRSFMLAASLTVTSILDIHLGLIASVLSGSLALAHAVSNRRNWAYLTSFGGHLFLVAVAIAAASLYWLIPVLGGAGPEATTLAGIGDADLTVFATVSDPNLGVVGNVLGLYGFWAEGTGRYVSMKQFVPFWPAVLVVLLALALVAVAVALRGSSRLNFEGARPWVLGLAGAGVLALILGVGVADPHIGVLVNWLDVVFPPYRGMRDAGKWQALLACVYAQLIPLGVSVLLGWSRDRIGVGRRREFATMCIVGLVLAGPLYYGNGLLYGAHGQIQPSAYPAGWYAVDQVLAADPHPGRAVFLPWHGYLTMSFVRNANRVVGTPAPLFFSVPVVASRDLGIPGIPPPMNDPDEVAVSNLVAGGAKANWASVLADHNIKYVLLAREVDWRSYDYLNGEPELLKVGDYQSILLYRNLIWRELAT